MLFLDSDGTLTPIVPRPEDARLSDAARSAIRAVAAACPVTIVSGRDRTAVEALVGVDGLGYIVLQAGSAAAARRILARNAVVDLILTVFVLPGGTGGPELAEEVRRRPDLLLCADPGCCFCPNARRAIGDSADPGAG